MEATSISITEKVRQHIESKEAGTLYFMDDFLQYGTPDNVRQALARLYKRKIIKRAATGIYYIPKIDKWDNTPLSPSLSEIAKAVAERSGTRIAPDGQNALNILGLSTQVPAVATFITDGAPRKIKTEEGIILELKHTSNMTLFNYKSEIMLLIITAMREIGEPNVTQQDMDVICTFLTRVSDEDFEHDIKLAPLWVIKKLHRA